MLFKQVLRKFGTIVVMLRNELLDNASQLIVACFILGQASIVTAGTLDKRFFKRLHSVLPPHPPTCGG